MQARHDTSKDEGEGFPSFEHDQNRDHGAGQQPAEEIVRLGADLTCETIRQIDAHTAAVDSPTREGIDDHSDRYDGHCGRQTDIVYRRDG